MIISQSLRNWKTLVFLFFMSHILFALFLGQFIGMAPDEAGYLFTFNNIYTLPVSNVPQTGSGWIAAPTIFLWIVYFPAKLIAVIGFPDLLALRLTSILYVTLALVFFLRILNAQKASIRQKSAVIAIFSVPSFFVWTSVGLREAFLVLELALILVGFNELLQRNWKFSFPYLILGAYGLVSTKFYIWVCMSLAIFLTTFIFFLAKNVRYKILQAFGGIVVIPAIIFLLTSSDYGLNYLFNHKLEISTVGERSGDSITRVVVKDTSSGGTEQSVTLHGDYSLFAVTTYLSQHPESVLAKTIKQLKIESLIEREYLEKIERALREKARGDESIIPSTYGHIIESGSISNPISVVNAMFKFTLGPYPWDKNLGFAAKLASLESPLWWMIYLTIFIKMLQFRNLNRLSNPAVIFPSVFIFGFILLSALVEVNLGTSFRHRSVILIPLVFLYIELTQKPSWSKEFNAKM